MKDTENQAHALLTSTSTIAKRPRITEAEYDTRVEEIDQQVNDGLFTEDEGSAKKLALKIARGVEVFIAMNEDCDIEVATDAEQAGERLTENCGGYMNRTVKLTIYMAPPTIEDTADVVVPDGAGEIIEVEAE